MKLKNIRIPTLLLCLLLIAGSAYSQKVNGKINKKILYVGYSPDEKLPPNTAYNTGGVSGERFEEDIKRRMESFKELLEKHFLKVETVHCKKYTDELSEQFDVTIFDGQPEPIEPGFIKKDPITGKTIKYKKAKYISDGFSKPAVLIAQNGSIMGEPIGLFTDWYCMCLYSHAFNTDLEHEIFKSPNKVKIKLKDREVPSDARKYPNGNDLPDKIPMWQVQTESSKDGKGYRTGVISHGLPFMESPDCEYISGGESMKDITAAALARHGNFFLWGFAASPDYMTESAQLAFVNAVTYIAKFDGAIPEYRKYSRGLATRMKVDFEIFSYSQKSHEQHVLTYSRYNESMIEKQKAATEKKSNGEKLDKMEEYALKFKPNILPTWDEYIQGKKKSVVAKEFDGDLEAARNFLTENRKYYKGGKVNMQAFDKDAQKIGIANSDPALLDAAISLLESGKDAELGLRILKRYTKKTFTTPAEWRKWYEKYHKYLFFSEALGFKFYVDVFNNPQFKTESIIGLEDIEVPEPDEMNPITHAAYILPTINGNIALVTKLKIDDGYYVYCTNSGTAPYIESSVNIELPLKGCYKLGSMYQSNGLPYSEDINLTIYKKEAVFIQPIRSNEEKEYKGILTYQYCNKDMCSPPIEKKLVFKK